MNSWHVTWSSEGRHPLAPEEGVRRELVRTIARVAPKAVSLFCVVDDHLHVVFFCKKEELGRYVQRASLAFRPRAATPLAQAYVRPVRDRSHMEWLAVAYILRQPVKHGLSARPATWSGSCFADLIGARVLPGLELRIADALPRWRLRAAYEAVGLRAERLSAAPDDLVRRLGATRIVAAASFAAGAHPELHGMGEPEVIARRAAVSLAKAAGLGTGEIAWALDVTPQAVNRLAGRDVPAALVKAVRLRLALEEAAAELPAVVEEPEAAAYGEPATRARPQPDGP